MGLLKRSESTSASQGAYNSLATTKPRSSRLLAHLPRHSAGKAAGALFIISLLAVAAVADHSQASSEQTQSPKNSATLTETPSSMSTQNSSQSDNQSGQSAASSTNQSVDTSTTGTANNSSQSTMNVTVNGENVPVNPNGTTQKVVSNPNGTTSVTVNSNTTGNGSSYSSTFTTSTSSNSSSDNSSTNQWSFGSQ